MFLNIYDKNFVKIGIIDDFTSLVINRRYSKLSDFELHLPLTESHLKMLVIGNIFYKSEDNEPYYIESRNLIADSQGIESLVIRGKAFEGVLGQRITWGQNNFTSMNIENIIEQLLNENVIKPNENSRLIPSFSFDKSNISKDISYQKSYGNLLEEIEKICLSANIGFKTLVDKNTKKITFKLYEGADRTSKQRTLPPVIFSRTYDNMLEGNYLDSINNYKNISLIAGAGEGLARKKTKIDDNSSGLDRYELYVDASDISDKEIIQVEVQDFDKDGKPAGSHMEDREVEIPWVRYEPLLLQRGKEKLAETSKINTFDAKIDINKNQRYNVDFFLGDTITVIDEAWGLKIDCQITEIQEVYDVNGLNIYPTLGNNIPTIWNKIKQLIR